jgi:hypothetical protein
MALKAPEAKAAKKARVPAKKAGGRRAAAKEATTPLNYCSAPPPSVVEFTPEVAANPSRQRAIIASAKKWMNKTVLHYAFFKTGPSKVPPEQAAVIRKAFQQWQDLPIGIRLTEVDSLHEAEIRVGFQLGDGSWSYIGRDILGIPVNERTMNFGWKLNQNAYGLTTAIHEIGHTLGMPHEHQNPFAGIVWNEEAVYRRGLRFKLGSRLHHGVPVSRRTDHSTGRVQQRHIPAGRTFAIGQDLGHHLVSRDARDARRRPR